MAHRRCFFVERIESNNTSSSLAQLVERSAVNRRFMFYYISVCYDDRFIYNV